MTTPPLDLTALRETANAATPGPWSWGEESEGWGATLTIIHWGTA